MSKNKRKLYKTIIVVWSEHDMGDLDLTSVAAQVGHGNAVCTQHTSVRLHADLCPRRDMFPEPEQCGSGCGHDHA